MRQQTKTPWPQSASELYQPSDSHLSAKLVPTFADRMLSRGQRNGYVFFQVAPQLYSRGWVDSIPDPLLIKYASAGKRTRTSGSPTLTTRPHWRSLLGDDNYIFGSRIRGGGEDFFTSWVVSRFPRSNVVHPDHHEEIQMRHTRKCSLLSIF
jgi:hypothetical protein